jgi:hypothetical protein
MMVANTDGATLSTLRSRVQCSCHEHLKLWWDGIIEGAHDYLICSLIGSDCRKGRATDTLGLISGATNFGVGTITIHLHLFDCTTSSNLCDAAS